MNNDERIKIAADFLEQNDGTRGFLRKDFRASVRSGRQGDPDTTTWVHFDYLGQKILVRPKNGEAKGPVFSVYIGVKPDGAISSNMQSVGQFERKPDQEAERVISFVNTAVKKNGDLAAYGDLSSGIIELSKDHEIEILEQDTNLGISIKPVSGQGHAFTFDVDKKTGELSSVMVFELDPEPE